MAKPKRGAGRPKTSSDEHIPDLVVRGLTAPDMAALEAEQAKRQATFPAEMKLSRNTLVLMLIREALNASKARDGVAQS